MSTPFTQERLDDLALRYQSYKNWLDLARKTGNEEMKSDINKYFEPVKMYDEIAQLQMQTRPESKASWDFKYLERLLLAHKPSQSIGIAFLVLVGIAIIIVGGGVAVSTVMYTYTINDINRMMARHGKLPSLTGNLFGLDLSGFILPATLFLGGIYLISQGSKKKG